MVKRPGLRRIAKPVFVICLGLVLYLIATNAGAGWLYVISAAIGAVVVVSAMVPRWTVSAIAVERHAPVLATAGEPFECSLKIKNSGRLARHLLEVEDCFAGDAGRSVAVRVGRDKPEVVRYTLENAQRGIYVGGEVAVESGAPFGLFYARRKLPASSDIVVHPRTFDVAGLPPSAVVDAERHDGSESFTLHRGHAGEFWGVREYRPGDPARLVAWKRSARGLPAGKLAVVELAREVHPPFVVALDLDPRAPHAAREMVISAAASLLLYAFREGREVRAHAGPQRAPFPEEVTPDSLLTWCACLQPAPPPDSGGASVELRSSTRRRGAGSEPRPSEPPGALEPQALVLVSCYEFAGRGPWMAPAEEQAFLGDAESNGRRVARLGPDVEEPWSIE